MWTPVVDISVYQGEVDFDRMRRRGVEGVIMRASHGRTIDDRLAEHVAGAREGGFDDRDLGFYTFLNPKRGSAAACAAATVDAITGVLGHGDTFYMVDIEDYGSQSPDRGSAPLFGSAYASWIREHIAEVRRRAPRMRIIGYTNAAYWDGPVPGTDGQRWVGDPTLAGELEWMVPRYPVWPPSSTIDDPVRLAEWIETSPKPPAPSGWADWAHQQKPAGPFPPSGVAWAGWQFSAGFNRQGATYGASSDDLDLNIVHTEAWLRWTGQVGDGEDGPSTRRANQLKVGEVLRPGDRLVSRNGLTTLEHGVDGDVTVARRLWSSGTKGAPSASLVMQEDGNLVLYAGDGTPLWFTGTHGNPGAVTTLYDGTIRVGKPGGPVLWSSAMAERIDGPGPPPPPPRTTVVRSGEGWYQIAARTLGDGSRWRELAALNGGTKRVLHPGDELLLPPR